MKTEQSEHIKNQIRGTNEFKSIRGSKARARCLSWGSACYFGYCSCGCQIPQASDLDYDLTGLTIKTISEKYRPTKFLLVRAENIVGEIVFSFIKSDIIWSIELEDNEYLDIDSESPLYRLVEQVKNLEGKK